MAQARQPLCLPAAWRGTHGTNNRSHGVRYGGAGVTPEAARVVARVTVAIAAENFGFSTETITVPAGAEVTIEFDNRDDGVPHNVAVYTDSSASDAIFVGEIVMGPTRATYTLTAPETPGNYFFRCDVHPAMHGAFIVT
ncbi:MAG: cupredoxin domain-containing protein [Methanoculleus marisnigri]|nr:cupredoxin domain-containing protein [Methanoculleus marisnigri]